MFKIVSYFWYAYVIVMFFAMLPDAVGSLGDSFSLLFVTSVGLVLPEIFRGEHHV